MTLLVLASGSPRRSELLGALLAPHGSTFEVRPTDVGETPRPGESADDVVRRLAVDKAEAALAAATERPIVVLAADTLVAVDGEVLGKPVDEADAARMLRLLSGSRHQVLTGVAVAASGGTSASLSVEVEVTHVHMGPWTDDDIARYVATGEPMDKAGSYAIQEVGDRFVTRIEGNFDNVVGLPLGLTRRMLVEVGVDLPPDVQPPDV